MDQGRRQYEFEPTDVIRLVGQTVSVMKTIIRKAGRPAIRTLPALARKSPKLRSWRIRRALQQVLVNLIDNAIKHSQPGQQVIGPGVLFAH